MNLIAMDQATITKAKEYLVNSFDDSFDDSDISSSAKTPYDDRLSNLK